MDRMTPEQAAALLARMDDLTTALHESEANAQQTRVLADETHSLARRLRVGLWVLGVLVVALVFGAVEIRQQNEAITDTQVTGCENANKTREGQRTAWRELLTVSTASLEAQSAQAGVKPPQEVLDYYRAYIDWIEDDVFRDRDCDNLDEPIPTPGPAPSFEDALKASLKGRGNG